MSEKKFNIAVRQWQVKEALKHKLPWMDLYHEISEFFEP